ncbi:hypothetical protein [Kribbia dieselivorans]|uniref:hypothetical protein n=1 Tax=Kribbia dieselivorans TaxID=331526 RepID=UPI000837ABF5|nr:hypothetical protein [Kribbia dieselivorans]
MSSTTTRRLAFGVISLTAAAALAACGTSTTGTSSSVGAPEKPAVGANVSDPQTFTTNIATAVGEQKSVHLNVSLPNVPLGTMGAMAPSASGSSTSSNSSSTAPTTGELTITGDIDFGNSQQAKVTLTSSTEPKLASEARLVDGVAYVRVGELTQGKFIKLDSAQAKSEMGMTDRLPTQKDFDEALTALSKDVKTVTYRGDENITDIGTCAHYTVTAGSAHFEKFVEGKAEQMRTEHKSGKGDQDMPEVFKRGDEVDGNGTHHGPGGADKGRSDKGSSATHEASFDLWLDNSSLPCQVTIKDGKDTATMTASKWGEDVKVEVPAAGDVTDLSQFSKMFESEHGGTDHGTMMDRGSSADSGA